MKEQQAVATLEAVHPALIEKLCAIFRREREVEAVRTAVNQRRIAAALGRERRSLEGLGRVRLEVDPFSYNYWGRRLGYHCWRDPQFLREFERDNEAARVRCAGVRAQVGWSPATADRLCQGASAIRGTRFRKSYG